jgi:hypothetical protein
MRKCLQLARRSGRTRLVYDIHRPFSSWSPSQTLTWPPTFLKDRPQKLWTLNMANTISFFMCPSVTIIICCEMDLVLVCIKVILNVLLSHSQ